MDATILFFPIARYDPSWEWQGTRWVPWPSIDLMERRVARLFPGARMLFHRGGVRWMVGDRTVAEIRGMERNRGLWEGWSAEVLPPSGGPDNTPSRRSADVTATEPQSQPSSLPRRNIT